MKVGLIAAGAAGGVGDVLALVSRATRAGAEAVWFLGAPAEADETVVAARLAVTAPDLAVGLPLHAGDNVFWFARRVGTLSWLGAGVHVVCPAGPGHADPELLARLLLLERLWRDPSFAAHAWLRPARGRVAPLVHVFGPGSRATAASLDAGWLDGADAGTSGQTPDGAELEVVWTSAS